MGTTDDEENDEDIAAVDLKKTVDIDGRAVVMAKGVVTSECNAIEGERSVEVLLESVTLGITPCDDVTNTEDTDEDNGVKVPLEGAMVGITACDVSNDEDDDEDKDATGPNGVEVPLESAMLGSTACDVRNDEDNDEDHDASGRNSVEIPLESAMVGVTACDVGNGKDDDDEEKDAPDPISDEDACMDKVKCSDDVECKDGVATLLMSALDMVTELKVSFLVRMDASAVKKIPTDVEMASKDET